jgi:succinate dehydrogenase/fumarate reductase cytochrome b subunit
MTPLGLYNFPMQHHVLFGLLILWTMVWKGMALWKAGRKDDMVWFIVLLLVNTVGILDIIYIYHLANRKRKAKTN